MADERELLSAYLTDRDVPCPVCRYNLRNLTLGVCPQCGNALRLQVGSQAARFGALLMAIIPLAIVAGFGMFVGAAWKFEWPRMPVADRLMTAGGAANIVLMFLLYRFRTFVLNRSVAIQRTGAIVIWAIQAAFFGIVVSHFR